MKYVLPQRVKRELKIRIKNHIIVVILGKNVFNSLSNVMTTLYKDMGNMIL